MTTIFEAAGGEAGLLRLAAAWHERVLADGVVAHAFSHGFRPDHTARLAAYWTEALGGPTLYTHGMGDQSHVLRLHSGNGEHHEMDRRAEACFARALDDAAIPDDPRLRGTLVDWFHWGVEVMDSHPATPDDVPDDLTLPRWSWEGPVVL